MPPARTRISEAAGRMQQRFRCYDAAQPMAR